MDDLKLIRKWKGSEQFTITYACFEFYMAGFSKVHECEHFLVRTLNNWENALDKDESVWALYLISQNDTINHDLLPTLIGFPKMRRSWCVAISKVVNKKS